MSAGSAIIPPHSTVELAEADERLGGLGGFFTPRDLHAVGLTPSQLRGLIRSGMVSREGRGLYRRCDVAPTENYSLALASARVPRSIVCLLSALRVHGIGTQAPAAIWLAIPHKARVPRLPELRLRIARFTRAAWTFGVVPTEFEGVPAHVTSPARTIVDCFRFERLVGAEVAQEALRDSLRQRIVTVGELSRVEEVLPSRRLRAMLEFQSV